MKAFLSKFLSTEKLAEIEEAYKVKNPDAKELPVYISKTRLDEEIGKKKTAEDSLKALQADFEIKIKEATKPFEDKLKAIPEDWSTQLEQAVKASNDVKAEYEAKLQAAHKDNEVSVKIYEAKGRNLKAIKALIDPDKPIDEELTRLKASDAYLFNSNVKGTGREDGENPGRDDSLSDSKMRAALGLPNVN